LGVNAVAADAVTVRVRRPLRRRVTHDTWRRERWNPMF
jgi:hypothetical protein